MNGLGPQEPRKKIPRLTPALLRFIEGMGLYFESQGIPRIGGRMLALLMIAHWPLSAEDLAQILKISRGSISTNLRLLLGTGLVEKAAIPGSRRTSFLYSDHAMEHRIVSGMESTRAFMRLLQQAAAAVPPRDPARHHIDDSLAASDLLLEAFDQAAERLRSRRPVHRQRQAAGSGG
jgi:predicted transcriptional regulator